MNSHDTSYTGALRTAHQIMREHELRQQIVGLADAQAACATGDASTIHARIGDLIRVRQEALRDVQQGGAA